jgi:hypothetical protein
MDILFRKTIEQCRHLGARGGPSLRPQPAPPQTPGPASPGGRNSRPAFANGPPSQFAPGRAVSLVGCGLRPPPDPQSSIEGLIRSTST